LLRKLSYHLSHPASPSMLILSPIVAGWPSLLLSSWSKEAQLLKFPGFHVSWQERSHTELSLSLSQFQIPWRNCRMI
jgi:hypothetical protein